MHIAKRTLFKDILPSWHFSVCLCWITGLLLGSHIAIHSGFSFLKMCGAETSAVSFVRYGLISFFPFLSASFLCFIRSYDLLCCSIMIKSFLYAFTAVFCFLDPNIGAMQSYCYFILDSLSNGLFLLIAMGSFGKSRAVLRRCAVCGVIQFLVVCIDYGWVLPSFLHYYS